MKPLIFNESYNPVEAGVGIHSLFQMVDREGTCGSVGYLFLFYGV